MVKDWTDEELEILQAKVAGKTIPELAKGFDRTSEEVSAKLIELGLSGNDNEDRRQLYDDPLMDTYGKALQAMQNGKFKDAAKAFESIIAETDLPELLERARQMLRVCQNRTDPEGGDKVDPFLQAVYEKNRGNFEAAMKICQEGDRLQKDERFLFLAASLHTLEERNDDAVATLARAIALNPKNRIYAFHDPDFEGLRNEPEHSQIFEPSA